MNRLADEEQASKDAEMLAARETTPTMARVCDDDLVWDAAWDALIDDDKLKVSKQLDADFDKALDELIAQARTELDAIDNAVIQAVLRLHAPTEKYGHLECAECHDGGDMGDHDYWPCLTVHTIADAYGIEFP